MQCFFRVGHMATVEDGSSGSVREQVNDHDLELPSRLCNYGLVARIRTVDLVFRCERIKIKTSTVACSTFIDI